MLLTVAVHEYKLISSAPCEIFSVLCAPSLVTGQSESSLENVIGNEYLDCGFRGISVNSLDAVLQRGIDVNPTNDVIYVGDLDKSLEYGDWPKVLLAIKWESLKRAFKEVPADISEEELEIVRREFPTVVKPHDNSPTLHCTRLREDDVRIARGYEIAYAWWIPGDPWAALKAVFILVRDRPEDRDALQMLVRGKERD